MIQQMVSVKGVNYKEIKRYGFKPGKKREEGKLGFLNLGTQGILAPVILCRGHCPVHGRLFGSISVCTH